MLGLIRLRLCQIVHPVEIGRDEDVGGSAVLDLLGQCRTRRQRDADMLAGLALILRGDIVHGILEAGRGKYQDIMALRDGRPRQQPKCDRHDESDDTAPPNPDCG